MDMATRLKLAELIQKDMDQLRQKADGAFACNECPDLHSTTAACFATAAQLPEACGACPEPPHVFAPQQATSRTFCTLCRPGRDGLDAAAGAAGAAQRALPAAHVAQVGGAAKGVFLRALLTASACKQGALHFAQVPAVGSRKCCCHSTPACGCWTPCCVLRPTLPHFTHATLSVISSRPAAACTPTTGGRMKRRCGSCTSSSGSARRRRPSGGSSAGAAGAAQTAPDHAAGTAAAVITAGAAGAAGAGAGVGAGKQIEALA